MAVGGYAGVPGLHAELEQTGRERLAALISDDDRRALQVKTVLVTFEAIGPAIVEYARNEKIDLIVMGTHGRRGLSRLVMGSVADKVVRTAPCPVLTVRHPEREFVLPDVPDEAATAARP